jgi:hypothetical protein
MQADFIEDNAELWKDEEEVEEEVEVGECIKLRARDIRRIKGGWYYVVSAFGLENVMFSIDDEPEAVGIYDEESGEIRELLWEE